MTEDTLKAIWLKNESRIKQLNADLNLIRGHLTEIKGQALANADELIEHITLIRSQQALLSTLGTTQDFNNLIERIEKLEQKFGKHNKILLSRKLESLLGLDERIEKLKKEFTELDEKHNTWWEDLKSILIKDNKQIREVLREFLNEFRNCNDFVALDRCIIPKLLKKLGGEKVVGGNTTSNGGIQQPLNKSVLDSKPPSHDCGHHYYKECHGKFYELGTHKELVLVSKESLSQDEQELVEEFKKMHSEGFKAGRWFEKHHGDKCNHEYILEANVWQLIRLRCTECGDIRYISEESRKQWGKMMRDNDKKLYEQFILELDGYLQHDIEPIDYFIKLKEKYQNLLNP